MGINGFEDRLLTAAEAGVFLGYAEGTIRNKTSRGEIPHVQMGRTVRYRLSDLRAWVIAQDNEAKDAA